MSDRARMRPTREQDLLLRAALSPDPGVAATARSAWLAAVDLDALDLGSLQLLPLLSLGVTDTRDEELERRIHHVARFSWLRTQMLAREVAPVVAALADAGLAPMLSKGAALVHAHGIESRLRPMFDIDVCVAPTDVRRARELLLANGFDSPLERTIDRHPGAFEQATHAVAYQAPRGAAIDLHWHLLHSARNPQLDRQFHSAAVSCELMGVRCTATSLEDTLVITVAHGTRWARSAAVRWVGDVALLLRQHPEDLDWDRVVARAREARLSRSMLDALDYVSELTAIEAPSSALRELRRAPVPIAVRLRRRRGDDEVDGGPRMPGRLGRLADAYEEDVGSHGTPGARSGPADAARFLARRWGLTSAVRVPAHAAWVAAGRPWRIRRLARAGLSRDAFRWLDRRPHYDLGTELRFDGSGDGHLRLGPGWWYPEPHGVWSRATCARVVLPLAQRPREPVQLDLYLCAPLAPRKERIVLDVVAGDEVVARPVFSAETSEHHVAVTLPDAAITREGVVVLSLVVDATASPADTRLNSDVRQLGIGLRSLRLSTLPAEPLAPPAGP